MTYVENEEKLDLSNVGNGAAMEHFNLAFQEVMENMLDIDRPASARTITISFKFTPDEVHREEFITEISCKTGLAPYKPTKPTRSTIRPDHKGNAAYEMVDRQTELPFGKVTQIREETNE